MSAVWRLTLTQINGLLSAAQKRENRKLAQTAEATRVAMHGDKSNFDSYVTALVTGPEEDNELRTVEEADAIGLSFESD